MHCQRNQRSDLKRNVQFAKGVESSAMRDNWEMQLLGWNGAWELPATDKHSRPPLYNLDS